MTTSTTPVFTGWPADATAFLAAIAADNTPEFWAAQRHRYDAVVRPPIRAMAAALEPEFGPLRIFRPYRDRRFRPGAQPYRVDAGGVATTPAGTELGVVLSATGLAVQVGRYAFGGESLRRYRAAVAGEPGVELAGCLDQLGEQGLAVTATQALTRSPRGYPPDHPRLALLRLRGLTVGRTWPAGAWLSTHEPLARVAQAWRTARPLVAWLDTHVGPAATE